MTLHSAILIAAFVAYLMALILGGYTARNCFRGGDKFSGAITLIVMVVSMIFIYGVIQRNPHW